MRVIEVEDETPSERWILWTLTGTAVGVAAGVLLAERFSGRRPDARRFLRRARSIMATARSQWGPLLQMALDLRDSVAGGRGRPAYMPEGWDEEDQDDPRDLGDAYEDADEYEAADAPSRRPAAADLDADDLDPDDFDDLDDLDDLDDYASDDEGDEEDEIGRRVLEAFLNDPVLSARNIEIAADDAGAVVLSGRVRARREVTHAVTIARGVPGVTQVRQRLRVR